MASHFGLISKTFFVLLVSASGIKLSECTNFTIINNCKETVWPGVTLENNSSGDGFALKPGQSAVFAAPPGWHGRIWGRTGCDFDKDGNGTCQTGDCGSNIKCIGPGQPPSSIAQFALGDIDYYDVSLVDGFNLPIVVKPVNGKGNCSAAGCDSDLRSNCPPELVLRFDGKTIACKSACDVFNTDVYCCRGSYSTPAACLPTNYSRSFKSACPAAYSFAYDDPTSVVTCTTSDYVVTFCSSRNQTQCNYDDKGLSCNGAKGLNLLSQVFQILILVVPGIVNSRVLF